jgi:PleD family two-component response regulator
MANDTPPKVILVDDDKDLLQLIAMRLTAAGYAVTAVESGEAALASLAVARPQWSLPTCACRAWTAWRCSTPSTAKRPRFRS